MKTILSIYASNHSAPLKCGDIRSCSTGMNKIFLSVIIPAYNESRRLPGTLLAVDKYLNSSEFGKIATQNGFSKNSYEIMVVSDGSTDNTGQVVDKFQGLVENLHFIDNKENHGKGWVTRQGMLESNGKYRLFTDADNSTSIEQVEKLLPYLKGVKFSEAQEGYGEYDVAIGSRALRKSEIKVSQPIHRVIIGKMANILIQIVAVPGIWDTQCGFKLLTEKSATEIFSKALIDRWGFDIEVLALARKLGLAIKEIPIVWVNDPESKVTMKGFLNTFRELFKVRLNLWLNKYDL